MLTVQVPSARDVLSVNSMVEQAGAFEREKQLHHSLVARLVERAEKAEVQLGQATSDLAALKQTRYHSHNSDAAGTGAIVNASMVHSPRSIAFFVFFPSQLEKTQPI